MRLFIIISIFLSSYNGFSQTPLTKEDSLEEIYFDSMLVFYHHNEDLSISNNQKRQNLYIGLSSFIRTHPKEKVNFTFISFAVNLTRNQIDTLLQLVDSSLLNNPYRKLALDVKNRLALIETGQMFPDMVLMDTLGNKVPIQNLRGKIVLINFWGSFCVPCRKEMPEMKLLYDKYKMDGFEILGISMDDNKASWLNAIKADKQAWINYCDLTPWPYNETAKRFSITYLPSNILIDRDGIVIGQDLPVNKIAIELSRKL